MSTAVTTDNTNEAAHDSQVADGLTSPTVLEIAAAFAEINDDPLIARLEAYRWTGRRGYEPRSLWRAVASGYFLGIANTSALIRRLQDDAELRLLCGLPCTPSQPTFSRFIARLTKHADLILAAINRITAEFYERLPSFGERVAIDSTIIDAYESRFKDATDADASWTAKGGPKGKKEWHYGYKFHLAVCAKYGIPLAAITSTGGVYDGHYLPALLEQAAAHSWFAPAVVAADRGYDSAAVHAAIATHGAAAVIPLRAKSAPSPDVYDKDYNITCIGGKPMKRIKTDPAKGTLYRCPSEGCHLAKRKGVLYCQDEHREKGSDNLRLFPKIPRKTPEWEAHYKERQSVERVFKSLKQARRLGEPYLMGLPKVTLHCLMSTLAYSASALAKLKAGDVADMRWQVRRVA